MKGKPTLKEYTRYRNRNFVKTLDGRFYVIETPKKTRVVRGILAGILIIPAFTVTIITMVLDTPWHMGIWSDITIALFLLTLLAPALIYRSEKFIRIEEGSEKYQEASAKTYEDTDWIIKLTITSVAILMCSLLSYSVNYLLSMFDTPEAKCSIDYVENGSSDTFNTENGDTTIELPEGLDGEVDLWFLISRTPQAQLTLDGKPINANEIEYNGPFISDFFNISYKCTIYAQDINDGSVLTLTCEEWQYEWVFDAEDA